MTERALFLLVIAALATFLYSWLVVNFSTARRERIRRNCGYRERSCDKRVLQFLHQLEDDHLRGHVRWVTLRGELREIINQRPYLGLSHACIEINNALALRLVLVLMRRVRVPRSAVVMYVRPIKHRRLRAEMARLFRSVGAVEQLECLLAGETDRRVLTMGRELNAPTPEARRERFLSRIAADREVESARRPMPFWAVEPVGPGKPPRPASFL